MVIMKSRPAFSFIIIFKHFTGNAPTYCQYPEETSPSLCVLEHYLQSLYFFLLSYHIPVNIFDTWWITKVLQAIMLKVTQKWQRRSLHWVLKYKFYIGKTLFDIGLGNESLDIYHNHKQQKQRLQVGLHQIKKHLNSKISHQWNEKSTNGMGKKYL